MEFMSIIENQLQTDLLISVVYKNWLKQKLLICYISTSKIIVVITFFVKRIL